MRIGRRLLIGASLPLLAGMVCAQTPVKRADLSAIGTVAPDFTVPDTDGKKQTLTELAKDNRPIVLFFFCGCSWCKDVGKEWATLQRGNVLPAKTRTIILYQGTAEEAKALAVSCALDLKQTILLPDPKYQVTQEVYHADPCPRVFVLTPDKQNRPVVRYVNNHKDDEPRKAPANLITASALAALRR